MSRLTSWMRGGAAKTPEVVSESGFKTLEDEIQAVLSATAAADLIVNDDIDGAQKQLGEGKTVFHQIGLGCVMFIQSVLSFEQEDMKAAFNVLSQAETTAWNDLKRAQKGETVYHSEIYPLGSEYAIALAYTQLMMAIVAVLNENITESIKGFYKLRKAYQTLHNMKQAEDAYITKAQGLGTSRLHTPDSTSAARNLTSSLKGMKVSADEDSDLEFSEAMEDFDSSNTPPEYEGHMTTNTPPSPPDSPLDNTFGDDEFDELFSQNPIDEFIHSSVCLVYGLMQLSLSLVPPVFARLLSIIGYGGDREVALKLLWKATKFKNINGGIAGLGLLGFYNNLAAFCEVLPTDPASGWGPHGHPTDKCQQLATLMQSRYPDSKLWTIERARIKGLYKDLDGCLEMLSGSESKMRQVAALMIFERAMAALGAHEYQICADSFIECSEYNNWSHAVYYYIAGTCYVELYRDHKSKDPVKAEEYKAKATELLTKAPTCAGKRKMMSKPLPFDRWVVRKLNKWEDRAKAWKVDLVDAIGASPVEETIYLWGGHKRMNEAHLAQSLASISWDRTIDPTAFEADHDERAISTLVLSAVLKGQGKLDEAREALLTKILAYDKSKFRGGNKDDYTCPCAHYDMGVLAWFKKDQPGADKTEWLGECEQYLDKAAKWDGYVLDARIGMSVTIAQDTLRRYKKYNLD